MPIRTRRIMWASLPWVVLLMVVEPRAGIRVSRRLGVRGPNRVQRADLPSVAMSPADGERVVADLRRRGVTVES